MKKSQFFWMITAALIVFIIVITLSASINKDIVDYTGYEQGTIVQTSDGIKVDGCWYSFDEWSLKWKDNNPILTKKGTHSFLGEVEALVSFLCGTTAFGTGYYAYFLQKEEK